MCGIAGILAFTEEGRKFLPGAEKAASCLESRGPDGKGLFLHRSAALAHRRLKVIDISDRAAQPMSDPGGRFTLVFNGEIFNYRELKKELLAGGIPFRSESDTEVLLHRLILEREKCLEKLDGEFCFAFYDGKEDILFLARDRFGVKPLYYYADADKFIFASEMKGVLAFGIPQKLDEVSLQTYLHLNYIPAPHTILESVKKFPAASFAEIKGPAFQFQPYYALSPEPSRRTEDYPGAQKTLRQLLARSVERRLIADVPLGAFLSGGIDSSIITALAAEQTGNLKTFSIGYRDKKYFDETHFAEKVAAKLKTEHIVFSLSNDDLFANLHAILDYLDEPFADSSALPLHILSMHTRKHVKVALSGDGADELFGGYNKHAAEWKARKGGPVVSLIRASRPILRSLPRSRETKLGNRARQLQKFAEGVRLTEKERYWRWAGFCGETILKKKSRTHEERKNELLKPLNKDFNSLFFADVKLVLENDMLVKTDRMSMANSLEVRVPFLDHRVVDFAFSLPAAYKIDGKTGKKILRDAFRDKLPAEIFSRGKQGFEVPLLQWFRTGLKSMITDDLLSENFIREQGLFLFPEIKKLLRQLFSASPDDAVARVWALIVFQYWWKKRYA